MTVIQFLVPTAGSQIPVTQIPRDSTFSSCLLGVLKHTSTYTVIHAHRYIKINLKVKSIGATEIGQWLRTCAALRETVNSVLNTYIRQPSLISALGDLIPSFWALHMNKSRL